MLTFILEQQANTGGATLSDIFPLILAWIFIMWFVAIRPSRKEEAKRRDKLNALKKNDRVVTTGGLIGTIDHTSDTEVVLKVDDKNNVKIRFLRTAIAHILEEKPEVEKKENT
jgi:preprotein translocase subunit YajC